MQGLDLWWTDWNEEHVLRHGVHPEEVEEVAAGRYHLSRLGGKRFDVTGRTAAGRSLAVVVDRQSNGT